MPWSLDYGRPREPILLDEFFLAAGKALYIANGFEAKLRYVLRMAKLANRIKEDDDLDAWFAYMKTPTDPLLGRALVELTAFSLMSPVDIQLLNKARDARNYIAHEGAFVGPLSSASARTIEQLTRYSSSFPKCKNLGEDSPAQRPIPRSGLGLASRPSEERLGGGKGTGRRS